MGCLLATTLNIRDDDFLNSNYHFRGVFSNNRNNVINMGNIAVNNGDYAAMFSPQIRNEGIISALQGKSILRAGDAITMYFTGNSLINAQINTEKVNTLIENNYMIKVGGGQVLKSSKAAEPAKFAEPKNEAPLA